MPPHGIEKTLSLNEARNFIVAMSKPMGEAVQVIQLNLKKIETTKKLIEEDDDEIEKFQERLHCTVYERDIINLPYPRTVCTHKDCTDYKHIGKSMEVQTLYKTECHPHCYLKGVPTETINNEQLYRCAAMCNGICQNCHHNYKLHMHMTYTTNLRETTFLSPKIQAEIKQKTSVKEQKEALIRELQKSVKENTEEKDFIYECGIHFGKFLKQNAMIPYNDSFSDYLDMLINEEEAKEKVIRDDQRIEQLKKDKDAYEEQKKTIKQTSSFTEGEGNVIQIKKIYEMKEELCSLEHNGKTLKTALGTVKFQ